MIGATRVDDDDIRDAMAPYKQVKASERLRAAIAQPPGPSPSAHRSRIAIGAVAATIAATVAVVAMLTISHPGPDELETRDERLDVSDAETVVFTDGTTVRSDELFDGANLERLRALFAEHGAELVIHERPVASAADGRVFTVTVPPGMADETEPGLIHLVAGGRVEVEVGRASATAGNAGLTLYEVFPAVEDAFDRDDPAATGEALEQLGFQIHWVLIEAPGQGHDVDGPPPGTVAISVLGPNGEWTDIDPTIDTLMIELATPAVADALGH
jgi:hypothetical protein